MSRQLAGAISGDPTLAEAGDDLKQEIAETMLVHALLADQAVQAAQKRPEALPAIKAAIAKGASSAFGMDVTRMQLGVSGLT